MKHVEYLSVPHSVSMADEWYEIAGSDHFWIQWRFAILEKYRNFLPPGAARVIEIGCGNGLVMEYLEKNFGYTVDGCDLNVNALSRIKKGKGRILVYDIYDLHSELTGKYSSVFLMDVLEHIRDDTGFLEAAIRHLKPGGTLVLNVPALSMLVSKYDMRAGHERRYCRKDLFSLFKRMGIEPLKITYWGGLLLPAAIARKIFLKFIKNENIIRMGFKPPGKLINKLLKMMMHIEVHCPFEPLSGTSLLAIGKIPGP